MCSLVIMLCLLVWEFNWFCSVSLNALPQILSSIISENHLQKGQAIYKKAIEGSVVDFHNFFYWSCLLLIKNNLYPGRIHESFRLSPFFSAYLRINKQTNTFMLCLSWDQLKMDWMRNKRWVSVSSKEELTLLNETVFLPPCLPTVQPKETNIPRWQDLFLEVSDALH